MTDFRIKIIFGCKKLTYRLWHLYQANPYRLKFNRKKSLPFIASTSQHSSLVTLAHDPEPKTKKWAGIKDLIVLFIG
jgi:hypothetical protein